MPAKTSVLLYLVYIVICARNFKHGRTDNQLKKQEPKTCSIRWGWISLAKKGWSGKGGTSAGRRGRGEQHQEIIPRKITWRAGYSDQQTRKPFTNPRISLRFPRSMLLRTPSEKLARAVRVSCFGRKPNCLSVRKCLMFR